MGLYCIDREELTLAIDTDSYAGNFERELYMFITGRDDTPDGMSNSSMKDCRAMGQVALAEMKGPLFDSLLDIRLSDPGDDGYHRAYVTICPTPGFFNVDGEHYPDADKEKTALKDKMHYPAFQSVAMFLQRVPTADELSFIKSRALAFAERPHRFDWDVRPKILGFRLLRAKTIYTIENL